MPTRLLKEYRWRSNMNMTKQKITEDKVEVGNAYSPEYAKILTSINETGECPAPFCKDEGNGHKHPLEMSFVYWKVTRNSFNYQNAEHAFLIVLNRHEEDFFNVTREEWEDLRFVIRTLVYHFKIPGYTLVWRMGEKSHTGASVSHLHAHLICGSEKPDKPVAEIPESELIRVLVAFAKPVEEQ